MFHIKFDPNGSSLVIRIDYFGKLTASYVYTLWASNSNAKIDERPGNNQNSQDDIYSLPSPVDLNINRIVEVFSTLNNPDDTDEREIVAIQISQGNQVLFTEENPAGFTLNGEDYSVIDAKIVGATTTALSDPFINLVI